MKAGRIILIIVIIALAGLIIWQIIRYLQKQKTADSTVTTPVSTPTTTTGPIVVVTPPVDPNIGKKRGIYSKNDNVTVWKAGTVAYKTVNKDDFIGTLKKEDTEWYYSTGTTGEEIFVTKVNAYLK